MNCYCDSADYIIYCSSQTKYISDILNINHKQQCLQTTTNKLKILTFSLRDIYQQCGIFFLKLQNYMAEVQFSCILLVAVVLLLKAVVYSTQCYLYNNRELYAERRGRKRQTIKTAVHLPLIFSSENSRNFCNKYTTINFGIALLWWQSLCYDRFTYYIFHILLQVL